MRRSLCALCAAVAALLTLNGCGSDDSDSPAPDTSSIIVFAPEGEDLNAYAYDPVAGLQKQVVISGNEDESKPNIPAVNGEVCFDPTKRGRFAIADDHTQPNPPPHWTIMQLHGTRIGELSYSVIREITPTYQGGVESADPVGCAFMRDGRLLTTDIGNSRSGPTDGQLTLWFTPVAGAQPRYCKLDITIGTAGAVYVDDQDRIYVASARGNSGIYRYLPPFPTADTAAGGCGGRDDTGAPLADDVHKERFITNPNVPTPNALVGSGHGTFYVSSILNGVIAEFDADGHFVRHVLKPPPGEHISMQPFTYGSPFGLGVDSDGTLYYSDLGLVIRSNGTIGPGNRLGGVRRIRFENGEPQLPDIMDQGLRFPDGIGVFEP